MNPSEHDNGIVPARGESSTQRGENPAYPADEFAAMDDALFAQVSRLIKESHTRVSATVNAEMTELYWQVGNAINENILDGDRQAYGSRALEQLAARLTSSYGRGWSVHHLRQCMKLATVFPDEEILYAVRTELSWTSIRAIMYIDDPLKREFYIEICKLNKWSSRTLQGRIKSMVTVHTPAVEKAGGRSGS